MSYFYELLRKTDEYDLCQKLWLREKVVLKLRHLINTVPDPHRALLQKIHWGGNPQIEITFFPIYVRSGIKHDNQICILFIHIQCGYAIYFILFYYFFSFERERERESQSQQRDNVKIKKHFKKYWKYWGRIEAFTMACLL